MEVHTTWLLRMHLSEVLRIERQSFRVPWTRDDFMRMLRGRNVIGLVAEIPATEVAGHVVRFDPPAVAGYCVYASANDGIVLTNMAVDPQFRHHGIGRRFLERLECKLKGPRRQIIAEVDERNLQAQRFFRACGWRCVAIARHLGHDGGALYRFRRRKQQEEWVGPEELALETHGKGWIG